MWPKYIEILGFEISRKMEPDILKKKKNTFLKEHFKPNSIAPE